MKTPFAVSLAVVGICLVPTPRGYAKAEPPPNPTYPQIVRIALAEGDVRVSRPTQQDGHGKVADWEKAVTGLPLESGFSLATGAGRAVIEFEDASTLYLAENSVLVCSDLHTSRDVPHTELALLTGTVTLHIQPRFPSERFVLRTPTDTFSVNYRERSDTRITAYMDAMAVVPLRREALLEPQTTGLVLEAGQTAYYRHGLRVTPPASKAGPGVETSFSDFDKWATTRYDERQSAMAEMMKQSGLTGPVPGLDQLAGQGKFVNCAPYGTCWEPPAPTGQAPQPAGGQPSEDAPAADAQQPTAELQYLDGPSANRALSAPVRAAAFLPAAFHPQANPALGESGLAQASPAQAQTGSGSPRYRDYLVGESSFPCGPDTLDYRRVHYSNAGLPTTVSRYQIDSSPWRWTVCHTGSWLHRRGRYVWVPGTKCHHHPPIRWVKSGHSVGYVPLHPRDEAGKLPINRENGVFILHGKSGFALQPINANAAGEFKLLNEPPKAFRTEFSPPLERAQAPRMEARLAVPVLGNKAAHSPAAAMPIVFDHKTQSFMISRPVVEGSNTKTVVEPVGTFLALSGGFGFGGTAISHNTNFNGGNAAFSGGGVFTGAGVARGGGGGFSGRGASGGFSSAASTGGGSRGGGGSGVSAGGGGGSHGGGGGGGGGGSHH